MKIPFTGKKVQKSYSMVIGQFKTAVEDFKEIIEREEKSKMNIEIEKQALDRDLQRSSQEIDYCQTAVGNLTAMFPGLDAGEESE